MDFLLLEHINFGAFIFLDRPLLLEQFNVDAFIYLDGRLAM